MHKIKIIKKTLLASIAVITILCGIYLHNGSDLIVIHSPKLVDWAKHKTIVFESDDWGMCSWVPDEVTFKSLKKDTFNKEFKLLNDSSIVARSTLESPEDLERLFKIFEKYKEGDSRHPVFQPNYVMSMPDYDAISSDNYNFYYDLVVPNVPSRWQRGDFIAKAKEGIKRGVWYPEYHGNTHFNRFEWMKLVKNKEDATLQSFSYQTFINGNGADNYEYDPKLSASQQKTSITIGINRFYKIFGYYPHSSIAPNYHWQYKTENILSTEGIKSFKLKTLRIYNEIFLRKSEVFTSLTY